MKWLLRDVNSLSCILKPHKFIPKKRLNENVPFRVRFKKEPSVRGRVYGFDCSMSRAPTELKVFIEFPIGKAQFLT